MICKQGINIKGFDWKKTTNTDLKKLTNTFFAKTKKEGGKLSNSSFKSHPNTPECSFKFNYKKQNKDAQDILNEIKKENRRIVVR